MKIAIDIRNLAKANPAGVEEYTLRLLHALFDLDLVNEYILFASGSKKWLRNIPDLSRPNVRHVNYEISNRRLNLSLLLRKKPWLDKLLGEQPDIFFFPNLNFWSVSNDVKTVTTVHDVSFELFPEYFSKKMRLWHGLIKPQEKLKTAKAILTVSKNTQRDVSEHFKIDSNKITVTPLSHDPKMKPYTNEGALQRVKSLYDLPEKFIFFLGTVEPRKNITSLITAYNRLRDDYNIEHHLVIAGGRGWNSDEVFKAHRTSNYERDIHFLGYVEDRDKPALYNLADVFVYPSHYEGFGLPPLEAMACGTPTIASQTSSLGEVCQDAALLINPNNPDELVTAVHSVLSDKNLHKQLRKAGLERAKEFSWKLTAERTLNVFKNL